MSTPHKKDGYTPIANEIMDYLCKYPIPARQRQCLDLIIRKTYGFNKKEDAISFSQFEAATNIDRRHVNRALNELLTKNIITIKKGIAKNGNRDTTKYCFNKLYTEWVVLPKKARGIAKDGKKVLPNLERTKDILQKKEKIYSPNLKKFVGDFINYVKKNTPTKAPQGKNLYEQSLKTLYQLSNLNGFDEEYVFNSIRWAKKDSFWSGQIYSLASLRNKQKNDLLKFQNLSIAYDNVNNSTAVDYDNI